jgi:2-oxoisovalerate dehydrogenase E1 component
MALRALRELEQAEGVQGRVLDLRWLKPLNVDAVAQHAGQCKRILVLDEGRPDGGIGEGIVTALVERGLADRPIRRITGKDCYIPLGDAAKLMLPDEVEVLAGLRSLLEI